ncbi:hypothetical protein B0A48_05633 [Cryoendolithus antarcticus]|uniref:Uncharacterized protein n=1 Tax=Cryoendolithus antarcticus TaxID=1507870 RepID=A0A1V8TJ22_9PEZI|nr:hypothetical protein B0A48_05633 [Cryoendolithus antarcticus]
MVRPCTYASCTFHTWRYGTGYSTLQAQAPCSPLPVQTPAQICGPWPAYIQHNHQHIHACLPQASVSAVPAALAKAKKEEEKKPKAPPLPPSKAATVVSAASTQLSAASTAVPSKAPTAKHPGNANAPPTVPAGGNYMFPPQHTKLHIFNKAAKVWHPKYATQKLKFKIFTASTLLTPAMVIENTIGTSGDAANEWVVTEVFEQGDGRWAKGSTIAYTARRAKDSLAGMGWTARRGGDQPPVWLTVHKA